MRTHYTTLTVEYNSLRTGIMVKSLIYYPEENKILRGKSNYNYLGHVFFWLLDKNDNHLYNVIEKVVNDKRYINNRKFLYHIKADFKGLYA